MLAKTLQHFLREKLLESKMSRKDFAKISNISYSVVNDLLSAGKQNPKLETLVKIADSFQVSINDIFNNTHAKNKEDFIPLTAEEISYNLRSFLINVIKEKSISSSKLSILSGMSSGAISEFIDPPYKKNSLGSSSALKISNYLCVSMDEMIGRTTPAKEKNVSARADVSQNKTPKSKSFVERLQQERSKKNNDRQR